MVSSIHTYIGSKFHIVHPTKSKQKGRTRRRVDSINASFRDLKQICKMGKKKVRIRRLEEEEEEEEKKKKKKKKKNFSSLSFSPLLFLLLIAYLCHFRANLGK